MSDFLRLCAIALALTVVIEIGIAWLLGLRSKTEIGTILLINVITNPALNYLMLVNTSFHLISRTSLLLLFLEAIVVLAEWLLLRYVLRHSLKRTLALSVAMNACSYAAGLLIFW